MNKILLTLFLVGCATHQRQEMIHPLPVFENYSIESGGGSHLVPAEKIKCKLFSVSAGDGCNTMTCQKCADGKKQWDQYCQTTAVDCGSGRVIEDYDKEFWRKNE